MSEKVHWDEVGTTKDAADAALELFKLYEQSAGVIKGRTWAMSAWVLIA